MQPVGCNPACVAAVVEAFTRVPSGRMSTSLAGLSGASDDEYLAQVEGLMELPLDQRLEGLAAAEAALRQRLGSSEQTSVDSAE